MKSMILIKSRSYFKLTIKINVILNKIHNSSFIYLYSDLIYSTLFIIVLFFFDFENIGSFVKSSSGISSSSLSISVISFLTSFTIFLYSCY